MSPLKLAQLRGLAGRGGALAVAGAAGRVRVGAPPGASPSSRASPSSSSPSSASASPAPPPAPPGAAAAASSAPWRRNASCSSGRCACAPSAHVCVCRRGAAPPAAPQAPPRRSTSTAGRHRRSCMTRRALNRRTAAVGSPLLAGASTLKCLADQGACRPPRGRLMRRRQGEGRALKATSASTPKLSTRSSSGGSSAA